MNQKGEHQETMEAATGTAVTVIPNTSNDLLAMLVQKDAPMEMIEKFMDLRDRDDAREAKNAYTEAMAAFKKNPPEITKDASVGYDTKGGDSVGYKHATLGNVTNTINRALGENSLSSSWSTVQENGGVTVTCTITHAMGHSESTSLHAAPDNSGKKNAIQQIGSTITYLERYTLLALTGLATHSQDDDGQDSGAALEFITEDQGKTITELIKTSGADPVRFLKWAEAETIHTIPQSKYIAAINTLKRKGSK